MWALHQCLCQLTVGKENHKDPAVLILREKIDNVTVESIFHYF